MSKSIIHTANSRGTTTNGWLHSRHTFSFGDYYDPEKLHFGELRVINDDMLAPGKGLGMHPHSNMEIITIPLEGDLEYKDDMNQGAVIRKGEIQVMSAGSGIFHSESNYNRDRSVQYLQLWLVPKVQKVKPRYQQAGYASDPDKLNLILAPEPQPGCVWIYQDAWFYSGRAGKDIVLNYQLKNPDTNGIYVFVIKGDIDLEGQLLHQRDGCGMWEVNEVTIKSLNESEFLLIEVPLKI